MPPRRMQQEIVSEMAFGLKSDTVLLTESIMCGEKAELSEAMQDAQGESHHAIPCFLFARAVRNCARESGYFCYPSAVIFLIKLDYDIHRARIISDNIERT